MPKGKRRSQKPHPIPVDFKFLMTQMRRDLKVEGKGRDQALYREMAKQFCKVRDEMANRPRGRSLFYFSWKVFEGVSNHFWPGSVTSEDRPSIIRETSRPFICITTFRILDTHAMSFEQLVDFIHSNGMGPFRWPKKSKVQRILERNARKVRHLKAGFIRPGDHKSNPIVISPLREEDTEMTEAPPLEITHAEPITKPEIPRLSVICQAGWDLNNKTIWIPAAEIGHIEPIVPSQIINAHPFGPVEPSISAVSFSKVPEKDVEAFLKSFLGSGEG
ncbi:hypothetical protein F4859DRAFT_527165 [Xylaria cf. heliscus]|nr:hypothetical protein F4859DRAFT_527165 [Xylaria cf. heliscus]